MDIRVELPIIRKSALRTWGLSSVSKKLVLVFLLCGLFLCYLVVSVQKTAIDMAEPTQYESKPRAKISYQQLEPLPQRPNEALPSEQHDTLPEKQINSLPRKKEQALPTEQTTAQIDKVQQEQIDSLLQENADLLSVDQVNKSMLRGYMAPMPLPSGQDNHSPLGLNDQLLSGQDNQLYLGQDEKFPSGREGILTSGHTNSLPSEQENLPPMEQIKALIGTLPREQIDSLLREQAGSINVNQIKTALREGQMDTLPLSGMKSLLQVQAKTPQGQTDTLSPGKTSFLSKPIDQIKTFLQGQDGTLSSGKTGPLPREQMKTLPGEQTDKSPSEKMNVMFSEDMRPLLNEQIRTLPSDQVKTIPREQLNVLPAEQKNIPPIGPPRALTREEIKEYNSGQMGYQLSTVPRDQVNTLPDRQMEALYKDKLRPDQGIPKLVAQSSPSLNQPASPPKQGTNPIKALLSPQQPSTNHGQAALQSGNPPGTSWGNPGPPVRSQGNLLEFTPPDLDLNCEKSGPNRPWCKAVPPEDIMKIKLPPFLKEYKNPCWRVQQPDPGTPPIRCIPYFFLAGVPKSGTTDLYARLIQHPQISSMVKKEIHWFTRLRYVAAQTYEQQDKFESYTDFFIPADKDLYNNVDIKGYHDRIFADSSVSTLWDNTYAIQRAAAFHTKEPKAAECIHHLNPRTKFVSTIRNPVERAYSDYLYFGEYEKSPAIFHDLVVKNIAYVTSCLKKYQLDDCIQYMKLNETRVRLYIGIYFISFREFFQFFPRDQFIILKLEDYSSNMAKTLADVIDFLELDPLSTESLSYLADTSIIFNTRPASGKKLGDMWPETRKLLTDFFRPYNEELGKMLGQYYNYNK